jgi:hypothetical protein
MAVRLNAGMIQYRESVLAALRGEGHRVLDIPPCDRNGGNAEEAQTPLPDPPSPNDENPLTDAIAAVRDQNYQAECEAIATCENLSDDQYQALKRRLVKTLEQRRTLRKYKLQQRYGIPVTAELVAKDDAGWYPKLQLHYFLTLGRPYLAERDATVARQLIELGEGNIFLPDFNRSQLGAVIGILETLGLPVLLANPERELKSTDEDLQAMAAIALANRTTIKTAMGIGLAKNASPITIVRRLLDRIDYSLQCIRRERSDRKRVRVYQLVTPEDGRVEIFKQWLALDEALPGSDRWRDDALAEEDCGTASVEAEESGYVQLCLRL